MSKQVAMVERSGAPGPGWYASARGGPPTPVAVSVTPVITPTLASAERLGWKAGARSAAATASTVAQPMMRLRACALTTSRIHKIGRASCRERGGIEAAAAAGERTEEGGRR